MARLRNHIFDLARGMYLVAATFLLAACGNGGSIDFFVPPSNPNPTYNRGAATTLVPASLPLAIESGKTTANGYHAKLQLSPLKGQEVTSIGYKVKLKHTARNR